VRDSRIEVVPHGSYIGAYPTGRPRAEIRAELGFGPETFAFLCFGGVRPYKEIELLLQAFRSLDLPQLALVVAGKVRDDAVAAAVRSSTAADTRITALLSPSIVPEDGVAELYSACDAAVLPRGDGWTSGSLVLALSLGLPAVAAARSAYERLLGGGSAGWLFEPASAESLRATLAAAASDRAAARAKGAAARAVAESLSWEETAERTIAALQRAGFLERVGGLAGGRARQNAAT
jgi:beta-1,4-mannosyltransferase